MRAIIATKLWQRKGGGEKDSQYLANTCKEGDNVQRMQTLDTVPLSNGTSQEWNKGAARLTKPTYPTNSSGQDPWGENARGSVHRNGVHGPQKHADNGDGDGVTDEGRNKPDHKLETEKSGVSFAKIRRKECRRTQTTVRRRRRTPGALPTTY